VSIISMTAARELRRGEAEDEKPQFGTPMRGERDRRQAQPPPLPKSDVLAQLLRYTPTEIVVLYITLVGLLPQIPPANDKRSLWEYDFRPRWTAFVVCLALVPLAVAAVQAVRDRAAQKAFEWPWLEFGLAPVAFVAWAIALPLSPLFSWHEWRGWAGSAIAVVVLTIIGFIGKILGRPLTYDD
jgi:hypothetical protein